MADSVLLETASMLGLKGVKTQLDLLPLIRRGLPYASLERLSRHMELTPLAMGSELGLAKRTVTRRANEKRLSSSESERLLRLTRGLAGGKRGFCFGEKGRRWV